jgi:hypothetical protein
MQSEANASSAPVVSTTFRDSIGIIPSKPELSNQQPLSPSSATTMPHPLPVLIALIDAVYAWQP